MKIALIGLSLFSLLFLGACSGNSDKNSTDSTKPETENNIGTPDSKAALPTNGNGKVEYLNTQNFVDYIYDFRNEKEWKFKSTTPCVIDFYADWCKPCKMIAPYMKELAAEYKGKIQFYKVNTDQEQELAEAFGIQSIPTIMMCPLKGKPVMSQGAMPKSEYQIMIQEVILNAK